MPLPFSSAALGLLLCVATMGIAPVAVAQAPARVLIVGTAHFDNPGQDLHNTQVDDVLTPRRQAELVAVAEALARFEPTVVAVEWPQDTAAREYARYRAGELAPSRNEVVQLGFRLAALRGLQRVDGIDLPGEFPMDKVAAWATAHGKGVAFGQLMQQAGALVARGEQALKTGTIADALLRLNDPADIEAGQALYLELLRYGEGAEQPGADLNAAWQARNLRICARLLQSLRAGDRAVVFYGQGHVHALQRCVIEAPDVDLVAASDWLPPAARNTAPPAPQPDAPAATPQPRS